MFRVQHNGKMSVTHSNIHKQHKNMQHVEQWWLTMAVLQYLVPGNTKSDPIQVVEVLLVFRSLNCCYDVKETNNLENATSVIDGTH